MYRVYGFNWTSPGNHRGQKQYQIILKKRPDLTMETWQFQSSWLKAIIRAMVNGSTFSYSPMLTSWGYFWEKLVVVLVVGIDRVVSGMMQPWVVLRVKSAEPVKRTMLVLYYFASLKRHPIWNHCQLSQQFFPQFVLTRINFYFFLTFDLLPQTTRRKTERRRSGSSSNRREESRGWGTC